MSLLYYSRMRFIMNLSPLLLNSVLPTGAHVVSVFGRGREAKIFADDLVGISSSHSSSKKLTSCRSHSATQNTTAS